VKHRLLLIGVLNLFAVFLIAQTSDSISTKTTLVRLEHADVLYFDKEINADAQILSGNVKFRHDGSYMYCDSAYYFEATNSLEAFSNVRMEQGDTLFVYGDYLLYDGNIELARLRNNVKMVNNQVTLYTDSLNYSRSNNIGYYFGGGRIVDEENELSSLYGQYSLDVKMSFFKDSVKLNNPQFILSTDTLNYNVESKVATILGPSEIVSDSGTIYSSKGWYDTVNDKSLLLDRSSIVSENRILTGDSILYDKFAGIGEVFGNISVQDTAQKVILEGQYGYYDEKIDYTFATDRARFIEYSNIDTLFLHADTLEMSLVDSSYREIKAYHGVRFFRTDLQGVCDSMQFNTRDSVLYMYTDPILWNERYQILGDTILVYLNDSTIDFVHVKDYAFAIQHIDSTYYNQLKGTDLKAYFEGEQVTRIDVSGNAESIFYPQENDGAKIGLNDSKSSYLTISLKDGKFDRLNIGTNAIANLTPLPDLKPEQKTLKDFVWYDYLRPLDKDDIFRVRKKETQTTPRRSNKFVH
jgi:Organic solvent tolerance protein OstA